MKLMQGDMMTVFDQVDHFIVCVGSGLRSDGSITMHDGVAGALTKLHPAIPMAVGEWIKANHGDAGIFWLRVAGKVGVFQNSILLRNGVNLGLISAATKLLKELAEANPTKTYALEAPNGKDPYWMIKDMMATLPENVQVWQPN